MSKMGAHLPGWGMVCLSIVASSGCGGTDTPAMGSSDGTVSGSPGSQAGQGGNVSSGGGQGGSSTPIAGNAGAAGSGKTDCTGTFATPVPGLVEQANAQLGSPALSPDALTLFYTRTSDGQIAFRRSTRGNPTSVFPTGSPVPELDAACQTDQARSLDLSANGLRAYIACFSATAEPLGAATLRVADRASLAAPFTIRDETVQVGPGAAISKDELTLFTASDVNAGFKPPRQFTRASSTEAFGGGAAIPGLQDINLTAPDPAPDGLSLFGGLMSNVVVTTRPNVEAPFAAPTVLFAPADATHQLGAPEISQDCRSLFFIRQTSANGLVTSELMMAYR